MNALIGDIGNTITKICVIEINSFKILKTIYLNTNKIFSKNFLKKALKKIFKKKTIYRVALFSSVVPKYQKILEIFLKKEYKIKLREIKENNIKKIDYWIGKEIDNLTPRIYARITPTDDKDKNRLILVAFRTDDMDNERWKQLKELHQLELNKIKELLSD